MMRRSVQPGVPITSRAARSVAEDEELVTVTVTDWTSAGGTVYPPGEHEVDQATADAIEASEERMAEQQKKATTVNALVVEAAPERQTMVGVHDYVSVQWRPDLDDPEASVHPEAEARAETTAEMKQSEFDLRAASTSPSATPAVPQADNKNEGASTPARSASTSSPGAGAGKPAPATAGSGSGLGAAAKPTTTPGSGSTVG